jgi:protein-S-isoprenylcysteine O-methyltransferase Ste14
MTWQEKGAFIVQRIVALITGLVIIAVILPSIVPPEMLPADASWFTRHAKLVYISVVVAELALIFQYWSEKLRKVGWVLLAGTFIMVTIG